VDKTARKTITIKKRGSKPIQRKIKQKSKESAVKSKEKSAPINFMFVARLARLAMLFVNLNVTGANTSEAFSVLC